MEINRLSKVSLVCAALLLPGTLFVGKFVEYVLMNLNPSHVNVTSDLAYLAPILYVGMFTYTAILLVGLTSGWRALKSPNKSLAKLCLSLLVIEFGLTILILFFQQATNSLAG